MNNQITTLRILVSDTLNPRNYSRLNVDDIHKTCAEIPSIEEGIFKAIREEIYGTSKASIVERHIRQIQSDCIALMDLLHGYADQE
ncbi:hypothetical protein [Pedobacter steynii]|uniref:Uncharacterized protein n=1 Tax=Pedobacter steynii TaxID=430522 RepID=A0A1D7QFB1_9SPHI|nr:hypothetical protein [Pedobacter steynii]AOM77396.1 hypothetical protein BFS30_09590 [Pedobacter steynii]